MEEKIIQQGAEAVLILREGEIIKRRLAKGYRIKELDDKIRRRRTRRERKLLAKVYGLIKVPKIKEVDDKTMEITMEYIEGDKLSESLDKLSNWEGVCVNIGENIGKLHDSGVIHGDLTTSNMILGDGEVYFIDFGLGFVSEKNEDKAVDLHLIKQALEAKHYLKFDKYFKAVIEGYGKSKGFKGVMERLEKVEKRGRYKAQF